MQKKQKGEALVNEKALAEQLLKEEKFDEALIQYKKTLDMDPEWAEGYCNVGLIHLNKGEFTEAEENLQISLSKDENLVEAYFNLGCDYQEKSDYEKALSFFKEVILREPDNANAFLRMGTCAQYLGRAEDAVSFFNEALRLQPNSLEAGAALSSLYIEKKDYIQAEEVLRVNLVSHPDSLPLHYSLGLILKEQEKYEAALAQFNAVVTLDGNHAEGFYHLADCCVELGFLKQAEPFFAKAYKLDNTFSEAVFQLGTLNEKMKKMDTSVLMYRRWVDMVENETWQFDGAMTMIYREKCLIVANHLARQGDNEADVAFYREKFESASDPSSESFNTATDTADKAYRVNLQIED